MLWGQLIKALGWLVLDRDFTVCIQGAKWTSFILLSVHTLHRRVLISISWRERDSNAPGWLWNDSGVIYHCRSFDTSRHQTPPSYEKIERVQKLYVNRLSSPLHVEGWFQNTTDTATTATLRPAPMGLVKKVLLTYRQPRAKTLRVISLSSAATHTQT